jgi:general secretion pathway protein D
MGRPTPASPLAVLHRLAASPRGRSWTLVAASLLFAGLVAACSSSKPAEPQPPTPEEQAELEEAGFETPEEAQAYLDDEARALTLADQKKSLLVDEHLANAALLVDQARLEQAEQELLRALELAPDDLRVKRELEKVGGLLGRPAGEVNSLVREGKEDMELRVQQLRAEAEDSLQRGKVMLTRGDYDGAIAEFTFALDHVRWARYRVNWQGLDSEASELLARARLQRDEAVERRRQEEQAAAHQALLAEEAAQMGRKQMQVAGLLTRAIDSFERQRYDDAVDYAEQVLRRDPRNEKASDIKDAAFRAGREKLRRDTIERKAEQYRKWELEIQRIKIPNTEEFITPDEDFWADITEKRASRLSRTVFAEGTAPEERELRRRLAETRLPGLAITDEESLTAVVSAVRTLTGLPLVVDPLAEEAAFDEGVIFELNLSNPLSVEQALNLVGKQAGEEVEWTIRHDAVFFTTREKARGNLVIRNHDVQDLIFGLTDFIGPRIDRLRLLDDIDDEEGGPFGNIGERPTIIDPDDLVTLVQENVAVGSWEDDGVSVTPEVGNLIVVHEPRVQIEVEAFLEDLRRFSSSIVTIESKFMTIQDNWLQEIGVEWRGLNNPGDPFTDLDDVTNGLEDMASRGLDNGGSGVANNPAGSPSAGFFYPDGAEGDIKARTEHIFTTALGAALTNVGGFTGQLTFLDDVQMSMILRMVEKSQQIELINDQVLSVHNTQRAYVTVINQQAYVQDFDVEVAQIQAIANPQINVLTDGIVLDVRPTIHHDRKYLTLEVQPTVANVVGLRDFSTSLGANTSPVTFTLPELEVSSVFTTVVIPDGGSILLGGLNRIRDVERRAEVPWLANIPLVGFFFKQEGYSDEKSSLMIMIRAWITDVQEEMRRFEQVR